MGLVYTGKVDAKQGVLTQAEIDAINTKYGTSGGTASAAVTAAQMGVLQGDVVAAKGAAATALTNSTPSQAEADYKAKYDAVNTGANSKKALLEVAKAGLATATLAQDAAGIIAANTAVANATTALADAQAALDATALAKAVAAAEAKVAAATGTAGADSKIVLEKRMNVYMNAAVETTSGLTFGASVQIRSNEGATGLNGARVYMSTNGLEVGVGNTNGAIESMPNLYNPIGLTGLGWDNVGNTVARAGAWDAYDSTGNGAEGVEVIYTAGGFTGHVSYSDATLSKGSSTHARTAGYVSYAMGDWTVALGMQKSDVAAEDKTILTVGGKVGDFGVKFAAADNDGVRKIALTGSATMGATTISGTISNDESADDNYMGLGLSHDLGGASLKAGVARTTSGNTIADMGVSFSF